MIKELENIADRLRNLMEEVTDPNLKNHFSQAWHQIIKSQSDTIEQKNISIDIMADHLRKARDYENCTDELSQELSAINAELAEIKGLKLCQH